MKNNLLNKYSEQFSYQPKDKNKKAVNLIFKIYCA